MVTYASNLNTEKEIEGFLGILVQSSCICKLQAQWETILKIGREGDTWCWSLASMHTRTYLYMRKHKYMHAYIHNTYTNIYMYIYIHTYIQLCIHACMHTNMLTHIHIQDYNGSFYWLSMKFWELVELKVLSTSGKEISLKEHSSHQDSIFLSVEWEVSIGSPLVTSSTTWCCSVNRSCQKGPTLAVI